MAELTQEERDKIMEMLQQIMGELKSWNEEIREDRLKREELRNERTKEIKNDSKPGTEEIPNEKTREQVALLAEIKHNRNQEDIKHMEGKSKKMRRMYPRNLIKTKEEMEMMNRGLIDINNIPITNKKESMNTRDYGRKLKNVISEMVYHKTVAYHLERTRGKWETTRVTRYGKISTISLFIDGPVTPCFIEPYGRTIRRKIETSDRITAGKMKYQVEIGEITSTGIIMKTMVIWTIRATEMMDSG